MTNRSTRLPAPLVTTAWLAQRLDDPDLLAVDASILPEQALQVLTKTIPGSVDVPCSAVSASGPAMLWDPSPRATTK
ncbi:hypothetical protein ACIRQP_32580 [Streptomyces sp. NPDC102274]|uniref:hypothetical protein n=1 Tax=Streptomyces sp. NPDC102274 TaxID=3366151 RepID=UPI0038046A94